MVSNCNHQSTLIRLKLFVKLFQLLIGMLTCFLEPLGLPGMLNKLYKKKAWETSSRDHDLRPYLNVPGALRTFIEQSIRDIRGIRDREEARVRCLQCSEQGAPYLPPFESSCPSQSAMQSPFCQFLSEASAPFSQPFLHSPRQI